MCVCVHFASFYYLVIHSILFHYIHAFIWNSLYPLDHLYVSRVKLSSFLYPLSIMTKWGRNTCLCKGELCFILLGGVLTSFVYTGLVSMFAYIVLIFDIYLYDDVCSSSPISTCVVSFLSLYTCFFLCMQSLFLFHT